jgi:hypothetical protein
MMRHRGGLLRWALRRLARKARRELLDGVAELILRASIALFVVLVLLAALATAAVAGLAAELLLAP